MSKKQCIIISLFVLLLNAIPSNGQGQSLTVGETIYTRYARVSYQSEALLRSFNKSISLGSLDYRQNRRISGKLSLKSDVSEKIDIIVERVETILRIYPKNFVVDITIMPNAASIRTLYKTKYRFDSNYLAFYAPAERTIYLPADDIKSYILAHELAHAIIDHYFQVVVPVNIHELLADYVVQHFKE